MLQVRGELFDAFQEGKTKILVCTDVASRGVDPDVSMNENRTHPSPDIQQGMETFILYKEGGGGENARLCEPVSFAAKNANTVTSLRLHENDVVCEDKKKMEVETFEVVKFTRT